MILLDILFYILFTSSSRTNKLIPEWSTIIVISVLFSFNLFSILYFLNVPIEKIEQYGFKLIPLFFILLNWIYYMKNKRYLKIIKKYSAYNKKYIYSILVIVYVFLSIKIFFIILKMGNEYLIPLILFITFTTIFAHITGSTTKG